VNWFRTFLPERIRKDVEAVFQRLMADEVEPVEYYENLVLRADGEERIVALHNTVLRDDDGSITGVLSSGEDVTERRAAQALQRRQEALAQLGQMAAVVAHELRNPIAGISGAITILSNRMPAGSEEREVAKDILKRLDSLKHMSQDLLQFARPRDPRFEPVQMRALLESAADLLGSDPEMEGIEAVLSGPEQSVSGDPQLLTNLFLNLMLNAAHAMDGRGRITLGLDGVDEFCDIAVRDEGPGIPDEVRGQVFEPFFSTKHRGTGLGLAIARKVVESHRGAISVECPPGGGTIMLVRLPLR
jgi:two-component system sensor histidine kinase HydH